MSKRNRIIIIGNGFDLAHGLKTSYSSFIDWLWDKKVEEINEVIKKYPSHRIVDKDDIFIVDEGKKGKFNDANELKRWITYKNGLLETLERKKNEPKDPKWSDIEDVYYDCLLKCNKRFDSEKEEKEHEELSIIKLNREFRVLRAKLLEYLQFVFDSADKENPEFIRLTNRMKKIFNAKNQDDEIEIGRIVFISFNYTNTLELYGYPSVKTDSDIHEIIHIHGSIKDENSIIFGYGDELDPNSMNIQENKDNSFLEFNKAVFYARSGEYQRIIPYIDGNSDYEVYILGHSCANSDRALLNEIFDNEHCKFIKYYYYDGFQGKEVNFKEQISNLYRIFGDNHRNFRSVFCPLNKSDRIPQIRDIENYFVEDNSSVSSTTILEILGIQFVLVQGGQLGDTKIDDFWIGRYPITELQWKRIIGKLHGDGKSDNFPVVGVSPGECYRFVHELSSQTGREFSLPTKEQWIYAASGGRFSKGYKYSGSDIIDEVAWYDGNSEKKLHPVGQKKPNELGIYDMSGNVWEVVYNGEIDYYSHIAGKNNEKKKEENGIIYAKDIIPEKKMSLLETILSYSPYDNLTTIDNEEMYKLRTDFMDYSTIDVYGGSYRSTLKSCRIISKKSIKGGHPNNGAGFRVVLIQKGNLA